jgi:hypothetical protein
VTKDEMLRIGRGLKAPLIRRPKSVLTEAREKLKTLEFRLGHGIVRHDRGDPAWEAQEVQIRKGIAELEATVPNLRKPVYVKSK